MNSRLRLVTVKGMQYRLACQEMPRKDVKFTFCISYLDREVLKLNGFIHNQKTNDRTALELGCSLMFLTNKLD